MISPTTFALVAVLVFVASAAAGWHRPPTDGNAVVHGIPTVDAAPPRAGAAPAAHAGWVERDPRAPSHDAVRVSMILDLSNEELFEREPRDPSWAQAMESDQRAAIERAFDEVFDEAGIDELECRTSTCRIVVAVASTDLEASLDLLQVYLPIGETTSYAVLDDDAGRAHVQWNVAFGAQLRTLAALAEHVRRTQPTLERRRRTWIEAHRPRRVR